MAQTIQAAVTAHITEHIAFKYRQEIEKQLGFDLPPDQEDLPEDIEYNLSSLISRAAGQLLQKDQAEQQMQQIQQQMQDPVIQMQQQDLQIRQAEVQRKAAKDQSDNQFKQLREMLALKKEEMRLETQKEIAGAQIGAKVGEHKENLASKERMEGTKIGIDIAKTHRGM
jgi:preprotein translocase subunit SecF